MSGPVYPYRDRRYDSWWWEASSKPDGAPTPYPVIREGIVRFLQDCPLDEDIPRESVGTRRQLRLIAP